MKDTLLVVSGFFMLEIFLASACFITNCPPGGKRSGSEMNIRQCEQCGPPGMSGLCYGQRICCSSDGCLIGTPETLVCMKENLMHHTPCQNPGDSCSGNDEGNPINGQCAGPGICCSTETCTLDEACRLNEKNRPINNQFLKENANSVFQNPLDRWIPRRFGLASGNHKRHDFGLNSDNSKISNEEYLIPV